MRAIQKKLSDADIRALMAFLASEDRPPGTLSFHELQGFLFAIASAPETIQPSEWLDMISNESEMEFADLEEAQAMLDRIIGLYNEINSGVLRRSDELPRTCEFHDDILANLDETASISQWSRGFILGHGWLEDLWDEYLTEELDEEFGATLMTLSFFGTRPLAKRFLAEMRGDDNARPPPSLDEFAETMRELFPVALASYADLGRTIFEVRFEQEHPDRVEPIRSDKIGRNDPCPCGSGKKYNKCCGAKYH